MKCVTIGCKYYQKTKNGKGQCMVDNAADKQSEMLKKDCALVPYLAELRRHIAEHDVYLTYLQKIHAKRMELLDQKSGGNDVS